MKTANRTLLTLILLIICSIGFAQSTVAIVDFMKVKPGKTNDYLEVEKDWRKIHQTRVDQGIITTWILYEKMYAGAADPYQYITVAIYDDFKKTENPLPWEWMQENYSEGERNEMMEKTAKSRTMVHTEVYTLDTQAENNGPSNYVFINRMKIKPGKHGAYMNFEKETVQPVFEEAIRMGARSGWNVWSKWLGDNKFQVVTVDGYSEYGQWSGNWEAMEKAAQKAHPGKDVDELMGKSGELRSMVSRELWKVVDVVSAPPQ